MSTLNISSPSAAFSRGQDRHRQLWAGGTIFDIVLAGAQTGGTLALLDQTGRRGDTTPLHVHREEAEIFYVLDGRIAAWHGDEVEELTVGDAVYLPAAEPHALGVLTDTARIVTITAPAGFADFVRAAGMDADRSAPISWEFDIDRITQAAPRHGIDIIGPPPALPIAT
ncbi:MAG: cupin domain-containing protein [Actinomycetota bacterium]|nr:cupin domain-containing protein [Actinomycetota bacterium]